jgi:protein TonB
VSYYASIRAPVAGGRGRRSGLLGVVLGVHVGVLMLLLAARAAPSSLTQAPLMVEFFSAPKPVEIAAPPAGKATPPTRSASAKQAAPRATAVRTHPLARPVAPALETTPRSDPAPDNSPVVAAPAPAVAPASAVAGGEGGASGNGGNGGNPGNGTGSAAGGGETGSSGARFDADYLRNPAPPYPPQSRRFGEEGTTMLRVFVAADGSVRQVEVKTTSGSSRLDDSALRTVRGWKFVPAKRGSVAVDSWVLVPIVFKLEQ